MLPANFNTRLNDMMNVKCEEIAQKTQEAFSKESANLAQRGMTHSSNTLGLYQKRRTLQVNSRVEAVLECQKRLISAIKIPFSDTLASEIKHQIEVWVSDEWCERSIQTDPDLGLLRDYKPEFREETLRTRNNALKKASVEIDLIVDELHPQTSSPSSNIAKELDQKFKILLSAGQAEKDFACWSEQLSRVNGQIALLFADLDNFKTLNTKYSEPRIDQRLLPEAMRLVESLVQLRGGAYKYGGDEYVVILSNHDGMDGAGFAEKLRQAFDIHKFRIDTDIVHITMSIGVAVWPVHCSSYQDLLTKASEAKTQAKVQKNCVRMAEATVTDSELLPRSSLSLPAQRLAVYLNKISEYGFHHDPMVSSASLCSKLSFTEDELALAADELADHGWIELIKTLGMGKAGFSTLFPTTLLFIETDPFVKGNDPKSDARELATLLTRQPDGSANLSELDKQLAWGPRRINPATGYLQRMEYVQASKTLGSHPYIASWIRATEKTRRFAMNS